MFNDTLKKIRNIGIFAGIAAIGAVTTYLAGIDTTAVFGVTGGAFAAAIIGYFTREGSTKLIQYLEDYAKDDGPVAVNKQ